jgi:tRNA threonylcarbamoyladenosine biosynthesis protein TsaB
MMARDSAAEGYALAIETSSAVGSIALGVGHSLLGSLVFSRPRAHAVEFFPAIDALFAAHGATPQRLTAVYVSSGPGSFTGLRIGVTAARTLAAATRASVVSVPTLTVIAQNAGLHESPPENVAVLLDAKRGHVYAAAFRRAQDADDSGETWVGPRYESSTAPAEAEPLSFLRSMSAETAVMGEGVLYHRPAVQRSGLAVLPEGLYRPRAETVLSLGARDAARGRFCDPRTLTPTYIRPPEAEEKWGPKAP